MGEVSSLIEHISKFVKLSEGDVEEIRGRFTLRNYRKKELVVQQHEPCKYENYVVSGCLRSFYIDSEGNEHTLHFAVSDWWITELESLHNRTPAKYYIEALEPTQVLQITKADLDELYLKVPVLNSFFRILHERSYIAQNKRIISSISMNGMERYLQFIQEYPEFHQKIPQRYIASYLGMTPVFLSQIRRKLAQA